MVICAEHQDREQWRGTAPRFGVVLGTRTRMLLVRIESCNHYSGYQWRNEQANGKQRCADADSYQADHKQQMPHNIDQTEPA